MYTGVFSKRSTVHIFLSLGTLALQAHLDPAGKNLTPAFLHFDWSYCCFQVRDTLGVVGIDPVLKVSPHVKIWWVQVWWIWHQYCRKTTDNYHALSYVIKCKLLFNLYPIRIQIEICNQNSPQGLIVDSKHLTLPMHQLAWAVDNSLWL